MNSIAATHMDVALQAIFRGNNAPHLIRLSHGGFLLNTGEPDPFGNFGVVNDPAEWQDAAAHLARTAAPAMFMSAGERDEAFEQAIEPSGFHHRGAIPAMSMPLDYLTAPALAPGLTFGEIGPDRGIEWAETLQAGYPVASLAAQSMSPLHVLESHPEVRHFAVWDATRMLGVSVLVVLDGIAGVYCVATLPGARGRGIGAVLTAAPLIAARERGATTAVLQASEMGHGVYRRLGFQDDGTVQIYLRMPGEPS